MNRANRERTTGRTAGIDGCEGVRRRWKVEKEINDDGVSDLFKGHILIFLC